ncbi:MAG: uracil-DNA glycosylase family protein [Rickettsiaceae bacterium]|jgi:uracil-DNA glycosylase family 4|nr:uracil-DNA glycosylase family protein [Rickettsiaceae bacterium]
MSLDKLISDILVCTYCANSLPCAPRPVLQVNSSASLCIIGQAPGRKVHETGIPWNDKSGERLRQWLGIEAECFYDAQKVAIIPIGFCYPGRAKSGDMPPRPECAPRWHKQLKSHLPNIKLTLLIGQYAQAYYLGKFRKATLTETVKSWKEYLHLGYFPLVHPSLRNQIWLKKNPWFEKELVSELQKKIRELNL